MRKSRESMENLDKREAKKENPTPDKLDGIKEKDIAKMEDDKTYISPWLHIDTMLINNDVRGVYDFFEQGNYKTAKEKVKEARSKMEKVKDKDKKSSNEAALDWIDDKIDFELSREELEEDKEKDNN